MNTVFVLCFYLLAAVLLAVSYRKSKSKTRLALQRAWKMFVSVLPQFAAELLHSGAGVAQIAVFLSTLTTVGLVTLPLECKYLGKKAACLRNLLAWLLSFAAAAVLGTVLA